MTAIKDRFLHLSLTLLLAVIVTPGWAQDETLKNIQQQFEKISAQPAQEKLYVHTDKNFYLAGEIIWFKIYYVDGTTHRPFNLSKVAYVEIVDKGQKPVAQAKIAITGKGGSGSFYLPLTLNSDNYTIRAYTHWMKNSGASYFFRKLISIVNTIKPPVEPILQDSIRVIANFFPEGGNMVQGIETKVAFHITDQNGKSVDARGIITDDLGDTIQNFSSYKFGIGNFLFRPLPARTYKATVLLAAGQSFTRSLPVAYDHGYVMNIMDNKDGRFKIRIQAKGKETGQRGEKVFLVAHTRHDLKNAETGYVNYENDLVLYIDKTKLGGGVTHLTLFNTNQQPVCERLVFTQPAIPIATTIKSDRTAYEKRQKVDLSISSSINGQPIQNTNFSVAVVHIDSLQSFVGEDIRSWFWLSSDVKGYIESPAFYFSGDADVDDALDNLLLTQGWRRFRRDNSPSPALSFVPKFIPEYRGHLITAKVTNINSGKAAIGVECFLSFSGTPYGFYITRTDSLGMAYFDVKDYYGPGEIIVQAGHEAGNLYRADILTPFSEEYHSDKLPYLPLPKRKEKSLAAKSISMQTQNIYVVDSIRRFAPPTLSDTFPFFGKAEYTYRLDDYKRFTTMEEVLREYVMPINVVLRNGKLYMSMYDEILKTVSPDQLLVLLDGVPLMDFNSIFSYDPLKVKKLDVIPRRYQMGESSFKGIASFETYDGKFDGFELSPRLIAVDYEGLQLQREFYSPVYESASQRERRIPDFRSTLFWTPDVPVDKEGKASLQFYTSDQDGQFLILLQGLNGNGAPVSAVSTFTVQ